MDTAGEISLERPRPGVPLAWLKPGVFAGALIPLLVFAYRYFTDQFNDPIAEILNKLGLLALVFLLATLACTPLKLLTGWTWPLRLRRMLGLFAWFYALLHFLVYLVLDQGFIVSRPALIVWKAVVEDVTERNFILIGFIAFVILIPLAFTSTGGMVRRLGAKNWQTLHRLTYLAAILGVVHFIMRVKADKREPLIYAGILLGLLAVRSFYGRKTGKT